MIRRSVDRAQAILILDHMTPAHLTRTQRETLDMLAASGRATIGEIAQRRGVQARAIYSTLERARKRAEKATDVADEIEICSTQEWLTE
jgi:DNA-binding CsgD family transcriptional regulator